MRYALAITCALALAGAAAPAASAGYACVDNGVAVFQAADETGPCDPGGNPSEANSLQVDRNGAGAVVFTDASGPITASAGCAAVANVATCTGASSFRFLLGAGNDTALVTAPLAATLPSDGGPGNDDLTGGPAADFIDGGAGADEIDGREGDDLLRGGADGDSVVGGAGGDAVFGDDGGDTVDGGDGSDTAEGGPGNDAVRGGNGDDFLESTRQACAGGPGADTLDGGPGNDLLCGGAGTALGADNDGLAGGSGIDSVSYRGRSEAVGTSLDGIANDGAQNEGDNVSSDVEALLGGNAGDNLEGGDGTQVIDGGPGGDILRGHGGDDVLSDTGDDGLGDLLDGGGGEDIMSGGTGPDEYSGGDGVDTVTDYAGRIGGVNVTLDDVPDDGEAGEGDNVRGDVEDVMGGSGADNLRGTGADNELSGGAGNDTIDGGGGNDGLHGGPGGDTLIGGDGTDYADGGGGNDDIRVRDGLPDRAVCGGGTDRAEVDTRDDAFAACETIDVSRPVQALIRSAVVTRAGFVVVDVACPTAERVCSGGVTVKSVRRIQRRFRTLGVKSYRALSGRNILVKATIPKSQRRILKRARRVKVRVIVTNYNSSTGARTTAARTVTVRTSGLKA